MSRSEFKSLIDTLILRHPVHHCSVNLMDQKGSGSQQIAV